MPRSSRCSRRRSRTCKRAGAIDRRSRARRPRSNPPGPGRRNVRRLQVRHQPLPGGAGRPRAGAQPRGDHPVATVSIPRCSAASQQAQEGTENGPDTPACKAESAYRAQVRAAVLKTMDGRDAGRVRLSDVEQPAAAHRRPEHAARRQQPVLLADDRLSRHQRADGLHARNTLPAGITFFGRAWDEATLIGLAYAYEQATHHRHAPLMK